MHSDTSANTVTRFAVSDGMPSGSQRGFAIHLMINGKLLNERVPVLYVNHARKP